MHEHDGGLGDNSAKYLFENPTTVSESSSFNALTKIRGRVVRERSDHLIYAFAGFEKESFSGEYPEEYSHYK